MLKKFLNKISATKAKIDFLYDRHGRYDLTNPKFNQGKILAELYKDKDFNQAGFQVFSQFDDDGLIQWLTRKVQPPETFIEFGVENYTESNTRFLLINNNWSGLVIDSNQAAIDYIKADPVSLYHDLKAVCSFVTKDNINHLIGIKEVGLLSIDIDGNDYWVWHEVLIKPAIVIVEFNAVFGKHPWTIPYDEKFVRGSNKQYWGASLKAFEILAEQKGYCLVGVNSASNNAYFVRNDKAVGLQRSFDEVYRLSKFREDVINGHRVDLGERFSLLRGRDVYNVETNKIETI